LWIADCGLINISNRVATLNRQSSISIANPPSQSTIRNLNHQIRNLNCQLPISIANRKSENPQSSIQKSAILDGSAQCSRSLSVRASAHVRESKVPTISDPEV
jgi:hypothetical protein